MGVTTILVTHDQEQAMAMGDRVGVMREGRLEQVGEPSELYLRPASTFVAGCLGDPPMSLLTARLEVDDDGTWIVLDRHRLRMAEPHRDCSEPKSASRSSSARSRGAG
jgi:multiple sugar transport system ATP-binding protein